MLHQKPEALKLPLTATFLTSKVEEGFKVHSLDFDLVSVAPTREEATAKLRVMVKSYIEYGMKNRLEDDILFSAPQEYWAQLTVDTPVSLMEPILIDHRMVPVFHVEAHNESRFAAAAA